MFKQALWVTVVFILAFGILLVSGYQAKADHPPTPISGLMCDTSEQTKMYLDYAHKNPTASEKEVADFVNKQTYDMACANVKIKLPGYMVNPEFEKYTLGDLEVTVLKLAILFPGESEYVHQFMYDLKEIGEPI